ncbi:MAG: hypothetical protein KGZ40_04760 [Clostridiales bacterium]|nr:hypothetical protein [Clostridiales bacterium]
MGSMQTLIDNDAVARLVNRDVSLFSVDVDQRQAIKQRLGWTDLAEKAVARLPQVTTLASAMRAEGVRDVVVLGMGGSSLASLVMASVLGPVPDDSRLHVLDTTSPQECARLLASLNPAETAFVLASKSGTTLEPLSLYAIFRAWMDEALGRVTAGRHFVVITDPGSDLERRRQKDIMRIALLAPPTVGGRFSALSLFGLAPTALAGIDVTAVVEHALATEKACRSRAEDNPGAHLAAWIADAYAAGRDKLTFVASPRYTSFGVWIEQLVAESTGKRGHGVVPVPEDGGVPPEAYGRDRALVVMREADDSKVSNFAEAARVAGVPVMEFVLSEPAAIGGEFVRWTFAVGLLGHLLGVNPFDEPDVAKAKAATVEVLNGKAAVPRARVDLDGVWPTFAGGLASAPDPAGLEEAIVSLLTTARSGDYLAVLAYLPYDEALLAPLRSACREASASLSVPACVEMGPRYLHSTGQLHKGGPDSGVFLMITTRDQTDVAIPGAPYTLSQLFRAQAEGDLVTLSEAKRRILRLDLPSAEPSALTRVADAIARGARNVRT